MLLRAYFSKDEQDSSTISVILDDREPALFQPLGILCSYGAIQLAQTEFKDRCRPLEICTAAESTSHLEIAMSVGLRLTLCIPGL